MNTARAGFDLNLDLGEPSGRRRTAADVRASLDRSMSDFRQALGRLERLARSRIDFGRVVADHAGVALLVCFVGGALLGAMTVRGSGYVVLAKPGVPRRRLEAAAKSGRRRRW